MGLGAIKGKVKQARWRFYLAVFALLAVVLGMPNPGFVSAVAAEPVKALDYKMAGDATKMRIVINFDHEPDLRWFLLRGPNRLVIDLPETKMAINAKDLKARGLVRGVRYGVLPNGSSRLVVTGKGPFLVERLDVLKNEDGVGYRIVADISAASEREFDEALSVQAETTGSTVAGNKSDRISKFPLRRFTIVIDPGHAGVDGAADGLSGTVQNEVTLDFAA